MPKHGTHTNHFNRFTDSGWEYDDEVPPEERADPKVTVIPDASKTIISKNDSPDIPFDVSINPYRGCEHGCVYCYARPTHEFLGYSAGLDFETKILVKKDAATLLRAELSKPSWKPARIQLSGVTDPYQPLERKLNVTRSILEVLAEARHPVSIITKNHLVTRDIDLLSELASYNCVAVFMSITTLDADLTGILEPRTSRPARRLDAIKKLTEAGIPAGVMVAPVIPAINDHEIPAILSAAAQAGATVAGYTLLRLPYSLKGIFEDWLRTHMPDRADKVLNRVRMYRDGDLNKSEFGERFKGTGPIAQQVRDQFRIHTNRNVLNRNSFELTSEHFRRPEAGGQTNLFS